MNSTRVYELYVLLVHVLMNYMHD